MSKKRKTKKEKIEAAYRLEGFHLQAKLREQKKDAEEFGYLAKNYVRRDLTKTIVYSLVIMVFLWLAQRYWG